jgi:mannose-binding lectin 2
VKSAVLLFPLYLTDNVDNHDIISVETKTIYSSSGAGSGSRGQQRAGQQPGPKKGKGKSQLAKNTSSKKGDSFGMHMLRVVGVLVIMGVLYFGWTAYRVQHGEQRF